MKNPRQLVLSLIATLLFYSIDEARSAGEAPVFKVTPGVSKVTFYVKSSVKLEGPFDKWNATLVFASTNPSTGVLDIKIQTASVNTGNFLKNMQLKGEHCFDVKRYPLATFHSSRIKQTGSNTFDVAGTFTLRGISKRQDLTFTVKRDSGGSSGQIKGVLTFDRNDFGLGGDLKSVTIADRVDLTIDFKATRVGPALVFKG